MPPSKRKMPDPQTLPAEVSVMLPDAAMPGKWKAGTKVAQVLSDIQQELGLFPHEGKLVCLQQELGTYGTAGRDEELRLEDGVAYLFTLPGECSAYDLCMMPLPNQVDCVQKRESPGGVMMIKTVDESPDLRLQVQQCQLQLPKQPHVYTQPQAAQCFKVATKEDALVQNLARVALDFVTDVIQRFNMKSQRSYTAYWTAVKDTISTSLSDQGSGSRRNSRSGSMPSTSHGQVGLGATAAAAAEEEGEEATATVAAGGGAAAAAFDAGGNSPASVYRELMCSFSWDMDVNQLKKTMHDQSKGLTNRVPVPKVSLEPDFYFCVSARGWQQIQQSLQSGISGSSFSATKQNTFSSTQMSTAAEPAQTPPLPAPSRGAASFSLAASTASSSVAAAAAVMSAAISEGSVMQDNITLVTGQMKPASIMCSAFDLEDPTEFLQRVAACDSETGRKIFSLAARCQQQNQMALKVVNQAAVYAFFTGTRLFVITCYSVLWVGELVKVEEEEGADGKIGLAATVTLSEPIFGKDAGPDHATSRGAYLWLADQTLAKPYPSRQIAEPDVTLAPNTAAAVNQQGGTGDDDDDDAYSDRDDH